MRTSENKDETHDGTKGTVKLLPILFVFLLCSGYSTTLDSTWVHILSNFSAKLNYNEKPVLDCTVGV